MDDAGSYDCVVAGDCGSETSTAASLSVGTPTAILSQPASANVCEDGTISFTISAQGDDLSYQWRKDGAELLGATSASYSIPSASAADAADYDCVVSGSCGSSTSTLASLTIAQLTQVIVQPEAVSGCAGDSFDLSLVASGKNLAYQWRKNGTHLAGANSNSYAINALNATHVGNYDCVITGDCGTETSASVAVNQGITTAIINQPQDATRCEGSSVVFTVSATGSNLSYQWRLDNVFLNGATSASLQLNDLSHEDAGDYDCVVEGDCGFVSSQAAILAIDTEAYSVNIATSTTVQGLNPLNLEALVTCGTPEYSYTWTEIPSQTVLGFGASLMLSPIPLQSTSYQLEVFDDLGQSDTDTLTLLVSLLGLDLDGNGINDIDDLLLVLPDWRFSNTYDANSDGHFNILDMLYINTGE